MPKLLDSRFVSGPRDELAAIDIYEVANNAVRNRAESILNDISQLLGGLRLNVSPLMNMIGENPTVRQLENLLKAIRDFLNTLSPELLELITDETSSLLNINFNDFPLLWNLGATQIEAGQDQQDFINKIDAFIHNRKRQIGDFSPSDDPQEVINLAVQFLVYSRLTEELIKRGLSSAIPSLFSTLPNKKVKEEVSIAALPIALNPKGEELPSDQPLAGIEENNQGQRTLFITSERWDQAPSNHATEFYDPDVLLRKQANENSDELRRQQATLVISRPFQSPTTFANDFVALEHLISNVRVTYVLAQRPLLIRDILSGIVIPRDKELKDVYEQVVGLLETIDPLWWQTQRGDETAVNLNVFRFMNHNARILFTLFADTPIRSATIMAHRQPLVGVNHLLRQQYPLLSP